MPRVATWDKAKALELRARGMGYSEIARELGLSTDTIRWWFRYAKEGPQEPRQRRGPRPGKATSGQRPKPKAKAKPKPKAPEWTDEKRLALVECATQAVERTGFGLGPCVVELARMLRERRAAS